MSARPSALQAVTVATERRGMGVPGAQRRYCPSGNSTGTRYIVRFSDGINLALLYCKFLKRLAPRAGLACPEAAEGNLQPFGQQK